MRKKDEMEKSEREKKKNWDRERKNEERERVFSEWSECVCKIMRVKIHPMYFCFGKGINSNLVYKRSQFMLPAFRKKISIINLNE